MKSIGFLQYNFQNGGAQKILIKTANLFAENGYKCTMLVINNTGSLKENLSSKIILKDLKGGTIRKSTFTLVKSMMHDKYDYIITTLLGPSLLLIFCKLLLFSRSKIIIREASTPSREFKLNTKIRVLHYIAPILLRFSHKIIAVSHGVKKDISTYYKIDDSKIKVIYNPVYSQKMLNSAIINWESTSPKKIIFLGRISRVKRIEIQIEAFALAFSHNCDLRFSIVGNSVEDEYVTELKALAKDLGVEDFIHWHGYCSDIELVLKDHQILLLTSSYEGLPSALIEALAYGLEVIACDCENGPREILDSGKYGHLIPYNECNPQKVSELILGLTENRPKRNGLEKFLERFSNESVYEEYLQIFN